MIDVNIDDFYHDIAVTLLSYISSFLEKSACILKISADQMMPMNLVYAVHAINRVLVQLYG